ncbi:MAG: hypothetical protein ABIF11_02705 [Nitrospirota bacterium]
MTPLKPLLIKVLKYLAAKDEKMSPDNKKAFDELLERIGKEE